MPNPSLIFQPYPMSVKARLKRSMGELLSEYAYNKEQLLELAGYSSAVAIAKCYPVEKMSRDNAAILVCCGPGNNGGVGLVCARHLKLFGYRPTVFYPQRPAPVGESLSRQCEAMDIPSLSYFPSEPHLIRDSFNLVVDALFGIGFKPPVKETFASVIETLKKVDIPICSVDIPSGWDVDTGDEADGLKPEFLVSISAPKKCAKFFQGLYHYMGGRFLPRTLEQKFDLHLPSFPGTDCVMELKTQKTPEEEKSNGNGE
uniref:NAD(P)H-hydrate epimerase n=1 Tax=Crassostrea virginica TaxID=6565 RepID=A0A8B8BKY1_CRAVI|nr:NAD(P)H-hydrate epimerase-like [Crassostrea virginica]